ncbi:MAG: hypothetical protein JJE16_02140 [Nitrospiraceae bacterium]|nr:hypothetical protein [Nitrospiraceae bacterium]
MNRLVAEVGPTERLYTGEPEELEYASTVMTGWRTGTAKKAIGAASYRQPIWLCARPSVRKEGRVSRHRALWRRRVGAQATPRKWGRT